MEGISWRWEQEVEQQNMLSLTVLKADDTHGKAQQDKEDCNPVRTWNRDAESTGTFSGTQVCPVDVRTLGRWDDDFRKLFLPNLNQGEMKIINGWQQHWDKAMKKNV